MIEVNILEDIAGCQVKICLGCGIPKLLSDFHKDKNAKDGLCSRCKKCVKRYQQSHKKEMAETRRQYTKKNKAKIAEQKRQYNTAHKEEITAYKKQHRIDNIEEISESERQYRETHKEERAEYRRLHKKESSEYHKKRYKDNKKEEDERSRKYRQTENGKNLHRKSEHKRRALKLNAELEEFSSNEIFERDGYICQLCGKKTRPDCKWTHKLFPNLDHIIPLSKGGSHTKSNTQCLCRRCNVTKYNTGKGDQLRLFG